MSSVIQFPSRRVQPDFLPQPGDSYQAFGLWEEAKPAAMVLVSADWTMNWMSYEEMGGGSFRILNKDADRDGRCAFTVACGSPSHRYEAIITGYNIFDLCCKVFNHEVKWIWEMPKGLTGVKAGGPVLHSIKIRKMAVRYS